MAASGAILAACLNTLVQEARSGVTTKDLDRIAERFILSADAEPVFKGYRGFPASICTSPNSMVVHGIPDGYVLQDGDILSIDVGVIKDGWVADAAVTVPIGRVSASAKRLMRTTREALSDAVDQFRPTNKLGDVSSAVQRRVEAAGFSIIRSLVGHGIGTELHQEPQVPNYGSPGKGMRLEVGMVFAVEPMVAVGVGDVRVGDDDWSIYSTDASLTAHFEHTVAVTEAGPRVLTPWDLEGGS